MLCSWVLGALGEAVEEGSVGAWGRGIIGGWGRPPDEELVRFIQMKGRWTVPQAAGQAEQRLVVNERNWLSQVGSGWTAQQRGR